jgi:hypothetical protein
MVLNQGGSVIRDLEEASRSTVFTHGADKHLIGEKPIDPAMRKQVESNIFHAAHRAIPDWETYPWHTRSGGIDAWQPNSSQALSIDVFGTLRAFENQAARNAVMNAIAERLGLEPDHGWKIDLEWMDDKNGLKEPRRTQVDVRAQGQKNLILMECKFTEQDGGSCSQVNPLQKGEHKGKRQCTGAYRLQTNPVNGREARCALTAKGIRYWDLIPEIFNFDSRQEYDKCPFKGGWFQWMRNLALCAELARANPLRPKVVVVYVDSAHMPFKRKIDSGEWEGFVGALKTKKILSILSYGQVLELGEIALEPFDAERLIWKDLKKHVEDKVSRVESGG